MLSIVLPSHLLLMLESIGEVLLLCLVQALIDLQGIGSLLRWRKLEELIVLLLRQDLKGREPNFWVRADQDWRRCLDHLLLR